MAKKESGILPGLRRRSTAGSSVPKITQMPRAMPAATPQDQPKYSATTPPPSSEATPMRRKGCSHSCKVDSSQRARTPSTIKNSTGTIRGTNTVLK